MGSAQDLRCIIARAPSTTPLASTVPSRPLAPSPPPRSAPSPALDAPASAPLAHSFFPPNRYFPQLYAVCAHGRHVLSRQYLHSKMNQCGPEPHMPQFHSSSVVSDLMILNE